MRPFEGKYMYVIRGDGDFQPKRRQYFFSKILNYIRLKIESTFIENSSKILYQCASLLWIPERLELFPGLIIL